MESGRPLPARLLIATLLLFILFLGSSNAKTNYRCSSSCDNIINITSPFRLKTDPQECGYKEYELSCENNLTVLSSNSMKYFVQAINYSNHTIRIVDSNFHKDNCSSIPKYSLNTDILNSSLYSSRPRKTIVFLRCENPVNSSFYIDTAPCNIADNFPLQSKNYISYYYYVVDGGLKVSDLENSCWAELSTSISAKAVFNGKNISYVDIHNELAFGVELSWLGREFQSGFLRSCHIDISNEMHCTHCT